jgi:ribonucleoside-triphosphate reductase
MRNLEDIERELAAAIEARDNAKGTPTEVYSRIVGYYRSVGNWNRGKREEYGERRLYGIPDVEDGDGQPNPACPPVRPASLKAPGAGGTRRIMLFVRPACPACPPAKDAAGRLGLPVDLVNTDTADGLAEAERRHVMSTPTAILLGENGAELCRARDSGSIAALGKRIGA